MLESQNYWKDQRIDLYVMKHLVTVKEKAMFSFTEIRVFATRGRFRWSIFNFLSQVGWIVWFCQFNQTPSFNLEPVVLCTPYSTCTVLVHKYDWEYYYYVWYRLKLLWRATYLIVNTYWYSTNSTRSMLARSYLFNNKW